MLKVSQYRQLNSEEIEGFTDKMIHTVAVMYNVDPLEVEAYTPTELAYKYQRAHESMDIHERYSETIEIDGISLRLVEFRLLTLAQFINLEALVSESFDTNIHNIAAHIYMFHSGGKMCEFEPEDYKRINAEYRAQLIDELPLNSVFGACKKYLKFRDEFFESYDLFQDPLEGVNPDDLEGEDLEDYNKELAKRAKSGNQWHDLLNVLSGQDLTKFDAILNTNLFLCFNQLSWLKSNKS